jgi:hypothetical protein
MVFVDDNDVPRNATWAQLVTVAFASFTTRGDTFVDEERTFIGLFQDRVNVDQIQAAVTELTDQLPPQLSPPHSPTKKSKPAETTKAARQLEFFEHYEKWMQEKEAGKAPVASTARDRTKDWVASTQKTERRHNWTTSTTLCSPRHSWRWWWKRSPGHTIPHARVHAAGGIGPSFPYYSG